MPLYDCGAEDCEECQTAFRCVPTGLKRNEFLNFDDGLLTIKVSGHGQANGRATLAFSEEQFELDTDGYQVVEIAPTELRALRDFLNRVVS